MVVHCLFSTVSVNSASSNRQAGFWVICSKPELWSVHMFLSGANCLDTLRVGHTVSRAELKLHEPNRETNTSALWVKLTALAWFMILYSCVTRATREERGVKREKERDEKSRNKKQKE